MAREMSKARKAFREENRKDCFLSVNSRPIYLLRSSKHSAAHGIVDVMMDKLVAIRPPQRTNVEKHRKNLLVLLLDLYVASLEGGHMWLGFPAKTENQITPRFTKHGLSGIIMDKQIKEMERLGYVSIEPGYCDFVEGEGHQSRVQATTRLTNLLIKEGIDDCLDDGKGNGVIRLRKRLTKTLRIDLALPKTIAVKRMIADMETFNHVVGPADIDLDLTDEQWQKLRDNMKWPMDFHPKDNGRTTFFRSFTNDMAHGGRLFGHWCHGLPSWCRKHITIDGEPTWELDYGSFHITLLYDLDGIPRPAGDDMYWYPGCVENDEARTIRKLILQIIINAKNLHRAYMAAQGEIKESLGIELDESEIESIAKGLMKHHHRIKKAFGSGVGTHLQFKDSKIMMGILLDLAADGIPALPVHDSCIVARRHEAKLRELMVKHYRLHTHDGCTPAIDRTKK